MLRALLLLLFIAANLSAYAQGVKIFLRDGKWGLIDRTGREAATAKYDYISTFNEGVAVVKVDDKYGYVDSTGKEIVTPTYLWAKTFSNGRGAVKLKPKYAEKYGYVNRQGRMIIQPEFDIAEPFTEGYAVVIVNQKYRFIDTTGAFINSNLYFNEARPFAEGLAAVRNDKFLWGYVDKTGNYLIQPQFREAYYFSGGLANVKINDKYGFIDKTGAVVIPPKYDFAYPMVDGVSRVELDKKWGFVDKTGKEITPIHYEQALEFSYGLARVTLNGKHGFIDKTGKEVIPVKLDYVHAFHDGLAVVNTTGLFGYIDAKGKEVIPMKYKRADDFEYGWARVSLPDEQEICIDKTGKKVSTNSDRDYGISTTVKIGTKTWATGNLKVRQFQNGDPIPEAKTDQEWANAGAKGKPVWCQAKHNPGEILYNWYAVMDKRGLAPKGWRVPSSLDWLQMMKPFGTMDKTEAGYKLKARSGWEGDGNGSDEYGFNAKPIKSRNHEGAFDVYTISLFFWTTTKEYVVMTKDSKSLEISAFVYSNPLGSGFSVRLVRD